jgi:hypothetical protein
MEGTITCEELKTKLDRGDKFFLVETYLPQLITTPISRVRSTCRRIG